MTQERADQGTTKSRSEAYEFVRRSDETRSNDGMRSYGVVYIILLLFSLPQFVGAVTTTIWENSDYKDFEGGKLHNVSIDEMGRVKPTRPLEKLKNVHFDSIIALTKLDNEFYIATIGPNGIYKFFPDKKENTTEKIWDTTEEIITDLASFNGKLYFSTIPDGNLYEITHNKVQKVLNVPAKFVWKLLPTTDALYMTTGEPGGMFELSKSNSLKKLYTHEKMHFKPLLKHKNILYFGGSPKSILYKMDEKNKISVMRDFGHSEVADIEICNNSLYVLTNEFKDRPAEVDPTTPQPKNEKSQSPIELFSLYEFSKDEVKRLFMQKNEMGTDLVCNNNALLIATNPQGKIYSYSAITQNVSLLYDLDDQFIFSLRFFDEEHAFMSTGNEGTIYKIKPKLGDESYYISKVLDTLFTSQWGNFTLRHEGELTSSFRTGNTVEPDETWTEWTSDCKESECMIKNSSARFIQYRVTFKDLENSFFTDVHLAYHTKNQKPIIRFIKINADSVQKRKPQNDATEDNQNEISGYLFPVVRIERVVKVIEPHSSLKEIAWDAFDYDQDVLAYDLFFKMVEDTEWKKIAQAEDLLQTNFLWNTESIPSGLYEVKLIAKDTFDNTNEEKKETSQISSRFLIDNEAPRFDKIETKNNHIEGIVKDSFSRIMQIDYSIDGMQWRMIRPTDGLYDEKTEEFSFSVELPKKSHSIALRAFDAESNLVTTYLKIQ